MIKNLADPAANQNGGPDCMKKKMIAWMLSMMLLAGILPAAVLAEGEDAVLPESEVSETVAEAGEDAEAPQPDEAGEPAEEKPAAPRFAGILKIALLGDPEITEGSIVTLKAQVLDANMGYSVTWLTRAKGAADTDPWTQYAAGDAIRFPATAAAAALNYRFCIEAEDGTVVYSGVWSFVLTAAEEEAEEAEAADEPDAAEEAEAPDEADAAEEAVEPDEADAAEEAETPDEADAAEEAETSADEPAETVTSELPESAAGEEAAEPAFTAEAAVGETITLTGAGSEEAFDEVDVREAADGLSAIFTSLPEGAEVTVLAVEGDWAHVIVNGEEGYIYAADIAAYLPQPEAEPAATAEAPAVEKKVTIFSSRRSVMREGETVVLTSRLEGFEDCTEITYQWYRDAGSGFEPVEGATEATYSFQADRESLSWDWQLAVTFN